MTASVKTKVRDLSPRETAYVNVRLARAARGDAKAADQIEALLSRYGKEIPDRAVEAWAALRTIDLGHEAAEIERETLIGEPDEPDETLVPSEATH